MTQEQIEKIRKEWGALSYEAKKVIKVCKDGVDYCFVCGFSPDNLWYWIEKHLKEAYKAGRKEGQDDGWNEGYEAGYNYPYEKIKGSFLKRKDFKQACSELQEISDKANKIEIIGKDFIFQKSRITKKWIQNFFKCLYEAGEINKKTYENLKYENLKKEIPKCPKCGKEMKLAYDKIAKKYTGYTWQCSCSPEFIYSKG